MSADAFAAEKAIIRRAEAVLNNRADGTDFKEEYGRLLKSYKKLFKMSRLLMRTSDRSQKKLKETEEALAVANRRMEKELNVGQEIQMAMLPGFFPAFPGTDAFSIHAALVPAREVGGDFYDYYMIDSRRLCFCIGDVSGKGVPAALFMAVTQTLIKSAAGVDDSTAAIITHVNRELSRDNDACMFVTIFNGILDIETGDLTYTNAGHDPPLIRHVDGGITTLDQRHGPAAGAMEGIQYREDRIRLKPDDLIFLFTDGVTEAMNPERELMGHGQVLEIAGTECFNTPETAVGAVMDTVQSFESGAEQSDDITLLALKFSGSHGAGILKLRSAPRVDEIPRVNREFNSFAGKHGITLDTTRKINLVFDELMNNIITYGSHGPGTHDIGILVHALEEELTVTMLYDGPEFDPNHAAVPNTDMVLDERTQGGLGIHLVRNLMDRLIYRRIGGRNILTLKKKISTCSK